MKSNLPVLAPEAPRDVLRGQQQVRLEGVTRSRPDSKNRCNAVFPLPLARPAVNGNTYFRPAWQQQRRPVAARSVTTTTVLLISSPMVLQDD